MEKTIPKSAGKTPTGTVLTVALSEDDAKYLNKKLTAEEFTSADDVVHTALELLRTEDSEQERWEREELIPAIAEFDKDPSSGLTYEQVRQHIEARRAGRQKAS